MIGRVADPADNRAANGSLRPPLRVGPAPEEHRAASQYALLPRPLRARWSR